MFSYNSTYASLKVVIGADWHEVNKLLMIFISFHVEDLIEKRKKNKIMTKVDKDFPQTSGKNYLFKKLEDYDIFHPFR